MMERKWKKRDLRIRIQAKDITRTSNQLQNKLNKAKKN